jgi:putative ABC transport system substrate-binding protein
MRLIGLAIVLAVGLVLAPRAAETQQAGRVWRIGVLAVPADADAKQVFQTFERGLRELGYVDKRNIIIEYRLAGERVERLPALASELVELKPDVIVAWGPPAAEAAKQATTATPVVFLGVGGPVERGLVNSLQ